MKTTTFATTLVILALVLAWCNLADAAIVLDQRYDPLSTPGAANLNPNPGSLGEQTFTVGVNGTLDHVDLLTNRYNNSTDDTILTVGIHGTSGGVPIATPIATLTVPESNLNIGYQWTSFDFSGYNIPMSVGQIFAISFTQNREYEVGIVRDICYDPSCDYPGGAVYIDGELSGFRDLGFATYIEVGGKSLTCTGFEPPMNNGPVTVKKAKALPLKATLLDGSILFTDLDIIAPPVIRVSYNSGVGDAIDVTDDALPAGQGTEGNQFEFDGTWWHFNLKTTNYTAPGTYTVSMVSGDVTEYIVDQPCTAQFVIEE